MTMKPTTLTEDLDSNAHTYQLLAQLDNTAKWFLFFFFTQVQSELQFRVIFLYLKTTAHYQGIGKNACINR